MPGTPRSIAQLQAWFETGDFPTQDQFYDLFASFIHYLKIKQTTGSSPSDVMSQKAVTDALAAISVALSDILEEDNDAGAQQIKNLEDPTDPQDADTMAARDAAISEAIAGFSTTLSDILAEDNDAGAQQIKNLADPTADQDADTRIARNVAITAAITALKDGVAVDGDTLNKLRGLIAGTEGDITTLEGQVSAIYTLLTSDNINLDTLQEIVDFIEEHESDIASLLSGKLDKTAKATEAEANAEVNDDKYITSLRLGTWLTNVLSRALTWAAKQTFTLAPRFSSMTASKFMAVDANKDLIDAPYVPEDVANKDTDSTFAANSDAKYPSQKAVKTAVALKEDVANKDTDSTFAANSDAKYPSQKAVKTAMDLKAPLDSPALTGVPTAPTPASSDNSTKIATTAYVKLQNFTTLQTISSRNPMFDYQNYG